MKKGAVGIFACRCLARPNPIGKLKMLKLLNGLIN
jgi:tRNA (Thr-GGU) A37 N-methylase|tara:strand:+ start:136 stop:240 length:105 start_codon:yes stop_codon:yes gene_type:complete